MTDRKPHPLSDHSIGVLRQIAKSPMPTMEVNAGVIGKFCTEHLVDLVQLPSPYKSHKGGECEHAQITERGRRVTLGLPVDPVT